MEWLDIYDEHGTEPEKQQNAAPFCLKGNIFLCAHVILENTDGLFLIQQRSDTKATRPGQWILLPVQWTAVKSVWTVLCGRRKRRSD